MSPNITGFGFAEGPSKKGFKGAGGFVLDMSEIQTRMTLLNMKILPAKVRRGLMLAGTKFMTDCVTGLPAMPIRRSKSDSPPYSEASRRKAGELRASGALFVDGAKKGNTRDYGEGATGKYQPTKYGGTHIPKMSHEACIVFNAPYATAQHESFPSKTEPTAGVGFMSEKLYKNGVTYIAIVARAIRL